MSTMRRATRSLMLEPDGRVANVEGETRSDGPSPPSPHGLPQATIAIAFVVLLLVLATTSQGAFAVSRWAPLALFALAILVGSLLARDGFALRSRSVVIALAGIWGLAAWSMLSM